MSKSLQEQLISAGLVDKKRAAEIDRAKRKAERNKRPKSKRTTQADEAALRARQAQVAKAQADRELEGKKREKAERKELAAQIRQLVLTHRVDRRDAQIPHQFVHQGRIKKIYVNGPQHAALTGGKLVVVRSAGKYDLVPGEAADKIRQRDPLAVIDPVQTQSESPDDDAYKDFDVPDDLMW